MSNDPSSDGPVPPGRWAQLTYASFDLRNGTRGGWQIKETSGEITAAETETLTARIITQFDSDTMPSPFPGSAEIAALPRRLSYSTFEDGTSAYWHSAVAGQDSTGRPGNVYTHAVLDRGPAPLVPNRPIELWRSPSLACPFGVEQVLAATIADPGHPRFGDLLNRDAVLGFIFDPKQWRLGLLSVLVDAIAGALHGGPPVVLITDSTDNAALWIGAVSFLTSPTTARRINFSAYERANALKSVIDRGAHFICVPRADALMAAHTQGAIVLDENSMPDLGEVGGEPHVSPATTPIPATYWSVLIQAVLVNLETALPALEQMEAVTSVLGDTGPDPSWPLAMVILAQPAVFPDHQDEAIAVIRSGSPDSLVEHEGLYAAVTAAVVGTEAGSTGDIWADLNSDGLSPLLRRPLAQKYVLHALGDPAWLARPQALEVPDLDFAPLRTAALVDAAHAALLSARNIAATATVPSELVTAMGTVVFTDRLGLIDFGDEHLDRASFTVGTHLAGGVPNAAEVAEDVLDHVVPQVVQNESTARAMVARVGALGSESLRCRVQEAVVRTSGFNLGTPGARIPEVLAEWIFGTVAPVAAGQRLAGVPLEPIMLELLLWQSFNDAAPPAAERRSMLLAEVLLWESLHGIHPPVLTRLWDLPGQWSARAILDLETRFPASVQGRLMVPAVLGEPWSPALEQLLDLIVAESPAGDRRSLEREAATLRKFTVSRWFEGPPMGVFESAQSILSSAQILLEQDSQCLILTDFADTIAAAAVISLSCEGFLTPVPRKVKEFLASWAPPLGPRAAMILDRTVDQEVLDPSRLRALAMLCIETSPGYPGQFPRKVPFIASVMVETEGGLCRLLDSPIRHAVATDQFIDPEELLEMTDHERFVRQWWNSLQPNKASARAGGSLQNMFSALRSATRKD